MFNPVSSAQNGHFLLKVTLFQPLPTPILTVWDPERIQNSSKQSSLVTMRFNLLTWQKENQAEGTCPESHTQLVCLAYFLIGFPVSKKDSVDVAYI